MNTYYRVVKTRGHGHDDWLLSQQTWIMATTETTSDAQVDLLRQLSRQFSLEGNTELSEELELLENVYLDEMQLVKNDRWDGPLQPLALAPASLYTNVYLLLTSIVALSNSDSVELLFHVTPSTGENANKKYVYLDLHLTLPQKVSGSLDHTKLIFWGLFTVSTCTCSYQHITIQRTFRLGHKMVRSLILMWDNFISY